MKLLFDENLSARLAGSLADVFPGSAHVRDVGLAAATDTTVWQYAKQHGYTIVSKDADFRQRSILFGAPPKVIALLIGNSTTERAETVLRTSVELISKFVEDPAATFLELP